MKMDQKTTSSVLDLAVLKNYTQGEINTTFQSVTKGEINFFKAFKILVFGGLAYLTWKYIIPAVFIALGKFFAIAAVIISLIAFIIFIPTLIRWMKHWAKVSDETLIKKKPFDTLDLARVKLVSGLDTVRIGKAKMIIFKDAAQADSENYEREALENQRRVVRINDDAVTMKGDLEAMLVEHGKEYRGEDEYIDLFSKYQKKLAESVRVTNSLAQAKDFTERFGARAYTIKKVLQKVSMGELGLEIKLADFDATYTWLKKQYDFAKEAKFVSSQMREAMTFEKEWQFAFASEVIANTVNMDMAITSSNFKDLESLTSQYNLDSDELYDNLNILADNISTGKDVITNSSRYKNTETVLTSSEKSKGGFNGLDF
jgi:hypothetical protein